MNSKLTLVLTTAVLLFLIGGGAQKAQAQRNQSSPSTNDKITTASAIACSPLTTTLLEKVLGQAFGDPSEDKMLPVSEGGAWGSTCQYFSKKQPSQGGVRGDFLVYVEASATEAKRAFDAAAEFYTDNSKPKPAIGDSAYWETVPNKKELSIHVLKGKVHFTIRMMPPSEKQLGDLAAAVAACI